jgi:hypothetical protein
MFPDRMVNYMGILQFFTHFYFHLPTHTGPSRLGANRMRSSHDVIFSRFSRTVLSAAVALVVAAPVLAQNTTAAIGGQITGADGKPVSGASVSIVHKESGSSNKLITDAEGRYAARGLRVGGPYTIVVTKVTTKTRAMTSSCNWQRACPSI